MLNYTTKNCYLYPSVCNILPLQMFYPGAEQDLHCKNVVAILISTEHSTKMIRQISDVWLLYSALQECPHCWSTRLAQASPCAISFLPSSTLRASPVWHWSSPHWSLLWRTRLSTSPRGSKVAVCTPVRPGHRGKRWVEVKLLYMYCSQGWVS